MKGWPEIASAKLAGEPQRPLGGRDKGLDARWLLRGAAGRGDLGPCAGSTGTTAGTGRTRLRRHRRPDPLRISACTGSTHRLGHRRPGRESVYATSAHAAAGRPTRWTLAGGRPGAARRRARRASSSTAGSSYGPKDTSFVGGTAGSLTSDGPDLGAQQVTLTNGPRASARAGSRGKWFNDGFRGNLGELICAIEEGREPSNGAREQPRESSRWPFRPRCARGITRREVAVGAARRLGAEAPETLRFPDRKSVDFGCPHVVSVTLQNAAARRVQPACHRQPLDHRVES